MYLPRTVRIAFAAIIAFCAIALTARAAATAAASVPLPPHVRLTPDGKYQAESGYRWATDKEGDFTVVWTPRARHRDYADVHASAQEGVWSPDAGFRWANDWPGDFTVIWQPGVRHPNAPRVFASATIRQWTPQSGYRFANQNPDDFSVVPVGPTEAQLQRAGAGLLAALVAHSVASETPDSLLGVIAVAAARNLRDELIVESLRNLFNEAPPQVIRSAANIVSLAVDGRLTVGNWASQQTQDVIIAQIGADSPEAAQIARFIGSVMDTYQHR